MNKWIIIGTSFAYLALLFLIAYCIERRTRGGKPTLTKGWMYALSLAVYCTGWTYYGSVGRAATHGMEFITIYLGPLIMCTLFVPVLQKIMRICKTQRINSIADFISTRYGKNFSLGVIVTICCLFGVIPYIALQLKAISNSFHVITAATNTGATPFWKDDSFYIAGILAVFVILFGTRSADASEKHEGLVGAIAFESAVKLIAFVMIGLLVTYGVFGGFGPLFKAAEQGGLQKLFTLSTKPSGYTTWLSMILVSTLSIILLPRQFQVAVVENTDDQHLHKAIWLFPLYLFAINIFVLPIAIAGVLTFGNSVNADTYVLLLPMHFNHGFMSLLAYIGGLSAAASMIIVETIALATMVSNHLVLPVIFSSRGYNNSASRPLTNAVLYARRGSIIVIILLAYLYDVLIAPYLPLVSIGLVSMAAVAQLAPAVFGGLYWKMASRKGATAAIIAGFLIWFYTLIIPSIVDIGFISRDLMTEGPWGLSWLRPQALFGMNELDLIPHSIFWSLLINAGIYVSVSVYSKLNAQELYQAEIFTGVFRNGAENEHRSVWKGVAYMQDIRSVLENFLGKMRAENLLHSYAQRHKIPVSNPEADPRMVAFAERILTGVIGSASARFMISSITKEEEDISINEVLSIVRESQQALELNKELKKKSIELSRATQLLKNANDQLRQMDALKDEFLYTVTHELRTPLTSIRALSEIVFDNPDMAEDQRQQYLEGIVAETERLTHLITQVLNLERYESGRQKLQLSAVNVGDLALDVLKALQPLAMEKNIHMQVLLPNAMFILQCDREMIYQALYNLVSNAVKFVPERVGNIRIVLREGYGEVQFWVEDNGRGIEPELQELIFDKFFQAKNQTLKKPVGSGLGLAICKRIIELHQGKIWVESEPGHGTKIAFSLPA